VRATATVGGNLVSPWAAGDGLAALVCLGASVVIAAPAGERTEQLTQRLHLAPDELVTRVRIPATDGPSGYLRHSLRPGFGPPVLSVCVVRGSRPRTVVNRGAGPEQWADTASAGPGDAYQAALARTLLRRLLARVQA
jgi:CO/xanthine dehydrogenase FAD-binding subunit